MIRFLLASAVCLLPTLLFADESSSTRRDTPPKLRPVFFDDFQKDSRADFQVKGDVDWKKGQLRLSSGSSVARVVNAGSWIRVALDFEPLKKDGDRSVTQLWFDMQGAADCLVAWERSQNGGKTSTKLRVLEASRSSSGSDKTTYSPVTEADVALQSGATEWTVVYRYGAIRIVPGRGAGITGHLENEDATINGIRLLQSSGASGVSRLATFATSGPPDLSTGEKEQLAQARRWNAEAVKLFQSGKPADAVNIASRELEVRERILGRFHYLTAVSLNNLGTFYWSMGESDKAEPPLVQASQTLKQILGEDHPEYATSLNNLSLYYTQIGEYSKAKPIILRAQEIRKKVLGKDHPHYATSLNNLGLLYTNTREFSKAEPLLVEGLEIQKKSLGENAPEYLQTLNNLGELYRRTGKFEWAEPLLLQASEIMKRVLGKDHPNYATSLSNLAVLYMSMGEYAKAEPLLVEARGSLKNALGEDHPQYVANLNNLAMLYDSMGEYAKAESLFVQLLETVKRVLGQEHFAYATILNNLAALYVETGEFSKAESALVQVRDIRKKLREQGHPDDADSITVLAMFYQSMGSYEKAELLFKQVRDIRKKELGEEHPEYAGILNDLAVLYDHMGEYAKAESLHAQARDIKGNVFGEAHPFYANSLNNLAGLYHSMGQYAKAEPLFGRSLDISADFLNKLAVAQSQREQLEFMQTLRSSLDNYLSLACVYEQSTPSVVDYTLFWKGATLVRQRAMRQVGNDPAAAEAFGKLQDTTRQLAALMQIAPNPRDRDAWRSRLDELTEEKDNFEADLVKLSPAFRETRRRVRYRDLLQHLPENAALVDFLEFNYAHHVDENGTRTLKFIPHFAAFVLRHGHPVTLLNLGPAQEIDHAVEVWRSGLTGRVGIPVPREKSEDLGEAKRLSPSEAGQFLRKQIWERIEPRLTGADIVIVSPDKALAKLPFGALPGSKPEAYLIEEFRLVTVAVPQMLPALLKVPPASNHFEGDLLVLGDVDYNADPAGRKNDPTAERRANDTLFGGLAFQPLPETSTELQSLDRLYTQLRGKQPGKVHVLGRSEATEANYRKLVGNCRTIHLATHGFFADPSKKSALNVGDSTRGSSMLNSREQADFVRGFHPDMLSGLAFAGANRQPIPGQDDGILFANEIAFLPLEQVDLVVLSACETGLGPVAGGEGLLGVQRAFQVAGARTTVASLWNVDDLATQRMMERFYRNLWEKKMTKLDALREAQMWMLKDPKACEGIEDLRGKIVKRKGVKVVPLKDKQGRTSPFFWAAFVLSGDWR